MVKKAGVSWGWFVLAVLWMSFTKTVSANCLEVAREAYHQATRIERKYAIRHWPCHIDCVEEMRYFYQRAIALCPAYPEAWVNLGDVHERLGDYALAQSHYRRALSLRPNFAVAYFGLGDVAFRTLDYAKAQRAYRRGLALDPSDVLAHMRLGLSERLQAQPVPDRQLMAEMLGDRLIPLMGAGGTKIDRRLPLLIPFRSIAATSLPQAQPLLHQLGQAIKDILLSTHDAVFLIEGHTGAQVPETAAWALSEQRARHVAAFLVRHGYVMAEQLRIKGYGNTRPLRLATEPEAMALNQRVEVVRLPAAMATGYAAFQLSNATAQTKASELWLDVGLFYEDAEARPQRLIDGATLRTGDGYRLYIEPSLPCYIYVFQMDSGGGLKRLYPFSTSDERDPPEPVQNAFWIPARNRWLQLDNVRGVEEIYVVATRVRREDVEDMFKRYTQTLRQHPLPPERRELTIVLKKMSAPHRYSRHVIPVSSHRHPTALSVERLRRAGISVARRFWFEHR